MQSKHKSYSFKRLLKKHVWENPTYARSSKSEIANTFRKNKALMMLLRYSRKGKEILDCGCGDGRILQILWRKNARFFGIDIAKRAIEAAKKRVKKTNVTFQRADLEHIPFPDDRFDFVYSTYTFEHVDEPEKILSEMERVLKQGGYLCIICPNYGSPLHPSGARLLSGDTFLKRAVKIFIKSHLYLFSNIKKLDWNKVYPKALEEERWESDYDITTEPYLETIEFFLRKKGLQIVLSTSGLQWNKTRISRDLFLPLRLRILQFIKIFVEFLGKLGVVPYKNFGSVIFIVAKKL